MPLLKDLNFTLLVSGSQLELVYQNIYTYQAPPWWGKKASPLLRMTAFVNCFYYWEGALPSGYWGKQTQMENCTYPGDGEPLASGAENSKNNTHQEGNVAVSPVTLVSKVLVYFS